MKISTETKVVLELNGKEADLLYWILAEHTEGLQGEQVGFKENLLALLEEI